MRNPSNSAPSVCALVALLVVANPAAADEIFPDEKLRAVIKEILVKKQINKDAIEEADLKTIYFLEASGKGIKDLTGLDKCTNLASIKLPKNEIGRICAARHVEECPGTAPSEQQDRRHLPAGEMPKLQYIQLENNQVAKLDGLNKLSNLAVLAVPVEQSGRIAGSVDRSLEADVPVPQRQ